MSPWFYYETIRMALVALTRGNVYAAENLVSVLRPANP
jgi:hypothetical protein